MKKNAFEMNIPSIQEILGSEVIKEYILGALENVVKELGIKEANAIARNVVNLALTNEIISNYEHEANSMLNANGVTKERISERLASRSDIIYSQIHSYLKHGSVLDLGCGDGKVGVKAAELGLEVMLADVYEHPNIRNTGLGFTRFEQGTQLPIKDSRYDNVLLLTVMHHSDDPVGTLTEAYRLAKSAGRIIAIESVYGIDINQCAQNAKSFVSLTCEEQRLTNIFFDHFYNRIIHFSTDLKTKVNVPFNFNTPTNWDKIARDIGMESIATMHLGIDQPTVPEYHTLHVWQVNK